jgi:hypothetical protein
MNNHVVKRSGLWLCALSLVLSCAKPAPTSIERTASQFDHPQTLRILDDTLVVLNSGYDAVNWNPGYMSLINIDDFTTSTHITTSALNPQNLQIDSEGIFIVETGKYDFSDFENPHSKPPFGIERFNFLGQSAVSESFIQLPEALDGQSISAPIDLRTIGEVTLITSGLFNIVWRIKWADMMAGLVDQIDVLRLENEREPGLASIVTWNEHFVLTEFNQDRLYLIDKEGDAIQCRIELGTSSDAIEGLQTPLVVEDQLFVSFAFSGHLERIDLNALLDDCRLDRIALPVTLGQVPNDLDLVNDELWVTMSGENHILRVDRVSGQTLGQVVLPISSNPWQFDFDPIRQLGAVSLWATDQVYLLNADGSLRFTLDEDIHTN